MNHPQVHRVHSQRLPRLQKVEKHQMVEGEVEVHVLDARNTSNLLYPQYPAIYTAPLTI